MKTTELPLMHFPFQPLLTLTKRRSRSVMRSLLERSWKQLSLRLEIRTLTRIGAAFVWTRKDGQQFVCATKRQLTNCIRAYYGYLPTAIFKRVGRLIRV